MVINLLKMASIVIALLFANLAFAESSIEFDGTYLKTQKGKYIEMKEISPSYYRSLSDMTPKYFVKHKTGMSTISSHDFKGLAIKGEYVFKAFSLHPLVKISKEIDSKMQTIFVPGKKIEIRKKSLNSDTYYFQPRNELPIGGVCWVVRG